MLVATRMSRGRECTAKSLCRGKAAAGSGSGGRGAYVGAHAAQHKTLAHDAGSNAAKAPGKGRPHAAHRCRRLACRRSERRGPACRPCSSGPSVTEVSREFCGRLGRAAGTARHGEQHGWANQGRHRQARRYAARHQSTVRRRHQARQAGGHLSRLLRVAHRGRGQAHAGEQEVGIAGRLQLAQQRHPAQGNGQPAHIREYGRAGAGG